jgi:hypothetical protein
MGALYFLLITTSGPRLWSGYYNPSASYLFPATYSDGTPLASTDLKSDPFPDYNYGYEQANYQYRLELEFVS